MGDSAFAELGSLAAALGRLDAVVFTAGIGENSADIHARVALRALRGIDTVSAIGLVAEIGDIGRFSSARQLMGISSRNRDRMATLW